VEDILKFASQQHVSLFLFPYGFHHLVELAKYFLGLRKDVYLLLWVGGWALKCLTSKDVKEVSVTQAVAKVRL